MAVEELQVEKDGSENIELLDVSASGRVRPWKEKKMANELLSLAYREVDERKAIRLADCSTLLVFRAYQNGRKRLVGANFCRVRLCPMCSWRRAMKTYGVMRRLMEFMRSEHDYRYLFLTLTVRNCGKDELSATLDLLVKAWDKFTKDKYVSRVCRGWYRACEVTHNVDRNSPEFDTFHPHFHVLLAVDPSYFHSRWYISQAKFTAIWRRVLRVDYDPIVDVRRVKGDDVKAVAECSKYSVKDADYILPDDWDLTVDTVRVLDSALHKRRFVAYGGEFKRVKKLLELQDGEDGDLVHVEDEDDGVVEGDEWVEQVYTWFSGYRQYCKV